MGTDVYIPERVQKYGFFPGQQRFMHCNKGVNLDICIYQGGYGSGKTYCGAFLGLLLANKYRGSTGLVVAKTKVKLMDTTVEVYLEILGMYGFTEGRDYKWLKSEGKLIFPKWGGSKIIFRSIQEPGKIKSITASWIHGEEISELMEADFDMLVSRLRDGRFERARLFGTTNPQATKGWINKYFVEKRNLYEVHVDEDGTETIIEYRRIIAPTSENKANPPGYVLSMANQYDPDYYRIFVMGEDGDYNAGLVVKGYSDLNEADTFYRPELPIYLGCDFNVDPMCWVLYHRFNGEFHYFDEICLENTTTIETVDYFHAKYQGHMAGLVITGDASGQSRGTLGDPNKGKTNYAQMRNRLSELGWIRVREHIKKENPLVADRVKAWNGMLCNQNGVRRIYINPKACPKLRWNLQNLRYYEGTSQIWEPSQKLIESDHDMKFYKHIFDAASYAIEMYHPIELKPDLLSQHAQRLTSVPYNP